MKYLIIFVMTFLVGSLVSVEKRGKNYSNKVKEYERAAVAAYKDGHADLGRLYRRLAAIKANAGNTGHVDNSYWDEYREIEKEIRDLKENLYK